MTLGERLLILFAVVGVPLIFIGAIVFVVKGGIRTFALKPLQKRFAGLNLHESRQPGDVSVIYHTYRGFLVWLVQEEHQVYAPPKDARLLLTRLMRFNLTWGMLSYGLLFVPLFSIGNYLAQKRSIDKQERELTPVS